MFIARPRGGIVEPQRGVMLRPAELASGQAERVVPVNSTITPHWGWGMIIVHRRPINIAPLRGWQQAVDASSAEALSA